MSLNLKIAVLCKGGFRSLPAGQGCIKLTFSGWGRLVPSIAKSANWGRAVPTPCKKARRQKGQFRDSLRRPLLFKEALRMRTLLLLGVSLACGGVAEAALSGFVRARGDQLIEGGQPFRFLSFNIPNLHLIEDNVPFEVRNAWRLPIRFEITDALESVRQAGGTVVRTYVISVVRTNDSPEMPRHVLGIGRFNETAFRALDEVLQVANEKGIRLILPLVDNWIWWGGRAEYAGFRGKTKDAFWTDPQLIEDFKQTVRFVVARTNTLTGVAYRDDPAILCWETGNELDCPASWTAQIAGFIKSLDTNHLVMDGRNSSVLREESLAMPEVDLVTTHHYPGGGPSFATLIQSNCAKAKGRKPYVVGEFGFVETAAMAAAMETVRECGMAGALLWSLRFRDRDGGFYWHSEPSGGNKYKAFHWPGFSSGADYDEAPLLALVQSNAFGIRGLTVPALAIPAPPVLLATSDAAALSWQGSAGAASYVVERAAGIEGPWQVAGAKVDETEVQYRPLFNDARAPKGRWFYRVRSQNRAGVSVPSNVIGPVTVEHSVLVDELADFSQLNSREGWMEPRTRESRQFKEDAHRLAGRQGTRLVYRLPASVSGFRVFSFFQREIADLTFSVSADGQTFTTASASKELFDEAGSDYKYWTPVRYQAAGLAPGLRFLRIEFAGEAQVGRVEIDYAPAAR